MHSKFSRYRVELHRYVNDSTEEVVERLTILPYPQRVWTKGLIIQKCKFDMHSHSFQETELKLHRYVSDSPRQVVERLAILLYDDFI